MFYRSLCQQSLFAYNPVHYCGIHPDKIINELQSLWVTSKPTCFKAVNQLFPKWVVLFSWGWSKDLGRQ